MHQKLLNCLRKTFTFPQNLHVRYTPFSNTAVHFYQNVCQFLQRKAVVVVFCFRKSFNNIELAYRPLYVGLNSRYLLSLLLTTGDKAYVGKLRSFSFIKTSKISQAIDMNCLVKSCQVDKLNENLYSSPPTFICLLSNF